MSEPDGDALPPRKPRPRPTGETEPSTFVPTTGASRKKAQPGPGESDSTTSRPIPKRGTNTRASEPLRNDLDPGKGPTWYERLVFGRVSAGQLATFSRQFSAYMNAGVDISKALSNLQRQFAMTSLGPVIGRLSQAVKRGDSFAEAVAREPQAFDALFVGMMRVAEARGGIPETLRKLSEHYESRQSLIRQARSAMIYPIVVVVVASCVVTLMSLWIIPMFAALLRDVAGPNATLPLPTRIMMGFSDFVQKGGWFLFPVVLVATPMLLLWFYRTPAGKPLMDRLFLRMPVFGKLLRTLDTTRFARTLSALLDAGVDIGSSLDLTADVVRMDPFRRAVLDSKSMVLNGAELSTALDTTRRFGPDVIAVVNSGEETGKLPETLNHLADDYEEQVAYMVRNLGQLVQPLLMIVMGGFVLFIVLAVFLPYISIITGLAGGR